MSIGSFNKVYTENALQLRNGSSRNGSTPRNIHENHPLSPIGSSSPSYSHERWYKNSHAKHTLVTAASAFYALILSIFSLVYELNQLVNSDTQHKNDSSDLDNVIFGCFMYGVSILFLLYCYYDLHNQFRTLPVKEKLQTLLRLEDLKEEPKIIVHVQGAGCLPGELQEILTTGSLILKFGCIIFALLGIIYYGFYIYYCFMDEKCANYITLLYFLSSVFMIMQTHFIFCNWKIKHTNSHLICRFGTIHLVATNLWTWFRFVFFEESQMSTDLAIISNYTSLTTMKPYQSTVYPNEMHDISSFFNESHEINLTDHDPHHLTIHDLPHESHCFGIECNPTLLGFMYTSVVEYSLIGATVMFIVWANMKHLNNHKTARAHKEHRRINFNNICIGLFLGLLFLAGSVAVMITYQVLNGEGKKLEAAILFSATDLVEYIITICACFFALYIMRVLSFVDIPGEDLDEEDESQELLDIIMLTIGLIGEMIYSGGWLFGIISAGIWDNLTITMTLSLSFRLLQVCLQSVLIFISRKLRIEEEAEIANHPGKNTITFLLIANITMMIMNLHESENFGVSQIVVSYQLLSGQKNWIYLVRSFAPLTIFYRFHSSVCLADIWTNTYSEKIDVPEIMNVFSKPTIRILYAVL